MMKKKDMHKISPSEGRIRRSAIITIVCDVLLVVAFLCCLMIYVSRNNVETYNQNIENVTNIAAANSQLIQSALNGTAVEVESAYNYCSGRTAQEMLDYLALVSPDEEYQLLRRDEGVSTSNFHVYDGFSTRKANGNYQEIRYEDTGLATSIYRFSSHQNGEIAYSQSFTNKTDALRYFAVFCGVTVQENGSETQYYIIKPQKESRVLDQVRPYSQYTNLSLAVCYMDGKYLANDYNFRSENFFDYIYKYNNLSIDQRNEIRSAVQADEDLAGALVYKDYQGEDSVFAYAISGESNNWLVVVSVPVSEFVKGETMPLFPLMIIAFLFALLLFNVQRLLSIVQQLRRSVARERIANASKSSFLSRMSHEIRTPLNAVIGYNTIARSDLSNAETDEKLRAAEMKVMDCLEKSEIASKHLLTIINDVLDMSAIESGKIKISSERFDFKGLITSLTTVFYSQAKAKGVDFEVMLDTLTEEWFVGDQMRVNQILTNLLSNALKFTPEGGRVTLKISQPDALSEASHIHFEVSDTGIGMSPEYLTHLWTPFEQADSSISRRFGGTGLGLSITKTLVDLMKGTISVDSTQGVGTTFSVDLTFGKTEQPHSVAASDFSHINALVVDDDESTCEYIRLLFNRSGAKCAALTSGEDAINAVYHSIEENDPFSLCLIDWRMPKMDGLETIRRIREIAGEKMPIVVLTAYDYSEIASTAKEIGVDRFLSKPLFQSSLFDLLATVSGTHQPNQKKHGKNVHFNRERILLAEDNEMNMEIATTILEGAGLVVDCAWNGKEAVEKFLVSEKNTYMAILMDVHMPEMNGHEATRAIRGSDHPEAKTIPIIAMTADAFAENVAEATAAGMNGHIAKPIDIQILFETLQRYKED